MPKAHARKKDLAALKNGLGIKHACAIALLDHPDADEREMLARYLDEYVDITTYREAVDYLRQEQADPRNRLLCEDCGWTVRMICPECPGCGCYTGRCSGWRHAEYQAGLDAEAFCDDCGDDECTCYEAVPA